MALTPITGTNWITAIQGLARAVLVENGVFFNLIPTEPAGVLGPAAKGSTLTIQRPNKATVADITEGALTSSVDPGETTGTITMNHHRLAQISLGKGQIAQSNYALASIWADVIAQSWLNDFEETAAPLYASLTAGTFNATGTSQAIAPAADFATCKRNLATALMPMADFGKKTHIVMSAGGDHDVIASSTIHYDVLGTPGSVEAGQQVNLLGFKLWLSQNIVSAGSPAEDQCMYFHERAMAKMFSIEPHAVAITGEFADMYNADILQYKGLYGVDVVEPTLGGVLQRKTAT